MLVKSLFWKMSGQICAFHSLNECMSFNQWWLRLILYFRVVVWIRAVRALLVWWWFWGTKTFLKSKWGNSLITRKYAICIYSEAVSIVINFQRQWGGDQTKSLQKFLTCRGIGWLKTTDFNLKEGINLNQWDGEGVILNKNDCWTLMWTKALQAKSYCKTRKFA